MCIDWGQKMYTQWLRSLLWSIELSKNIKIVIMHWYLQGGLKPWSA